MTKNKETSIDELAMMVQKGFQSADEKMDKGFKQVNHRIDSIREEVNAVKGEMHEVKQQVNTMSIEIDNLQRSQERIEVRLDEIVPEVKKQRQILKEHDKRITVFEKRALPAN